jgi:transitional endoplasmic reticulum ATPase
LRPGRFDLSIALPPPERPARLEILRVHTRGRPLGPDVDLEALAGAMERLVGADIEGVCRRAGMLAIRDFLAAGGASASDCTGLLILRRHFEEALVLVGKQLGGPQAGGAS